MTDRIKDINKAIVYEITTAMGDDGLNALLTAQLCRGRSRWHTTLLVYSDDTRSW